MAALKDILNQAALMAEKAETPGQARDALGNIALILEQDPRLGTAAVALRNTAADKDDRKVLAACRASAVKYREWAARADQIATSQNPATNTQPTDVQTGSASRSTPSTSCQPKSASRKVCGYGLSVNTPVLCGGGPTIEQDYLRRLRCPAGRKVKFQREGSDVLEIKPNYLSLPQVRFYPGTDGLMQGVTQESVCAPLHIDVYKVICECGEHIERIWMDMYHRGPDKVIGARGWKLESDDGPNLTFPAVWVFHTAERVNKIKSLDELAAALHKERKFNMQVEKASSPKGASQIIDSHGGSYLFDAILDDPIRKRFMFLVPYKSTRYRIVGLRRSRKFSVDEVKVLLLHRLKKHIAERWFGGDGPDSQKSADEANATLRAVANAQTVRDAIAAYPVYF